MADSNPGNFANRPKEEVRAAAAKGGKASSGSHGSSDAGEETAKRGFAAMDPEKHSEISSAGGKASSGSFEPGSWRAKEAGHKGGLASSGKSS